MYLEEVNNYIKSVLKENNFSVKKSLPIIKECFKTLTPSIGTIYKISKKAKKEEFQKLISNAKKKVEQLQPTDEARSIDEQPSPSAAPKRDDGQSTPVVVPTMDYDQPAAVAVSTMDYEVTAPVLGPIMNDGQPTPLVESNMDYEQPITVLGSLVDEKQPAQFAVSIMEYEHPALVVNAIVDDKQSVPVAKPIVEYELLAPVAVSKMNDGQPTPLMESNMDYEQPTIVVDAIQNNKQSAPVAKQIVEYELLAPVAVSKIDDGQRAALVESNMNCEKPITVLGSLLDEKQPAQVAVSIVKYELPAHVVNAILDDKQSAPVAKTIVEYELLAPVAVSKMNDGQSAPLVESNIDDEQPSEDCVSIMEYEVTDDEEPAPPCESIVENELPASVVVPTMDDNQPAPTIIFDDPKDESHKFNKPYMIQCTSCKEFEHGTCDYFTKIINLVEIKDFRCKKCKNAQNLFPLTIPSWEDLSTGVNQMQLKYKSQKGFVKFQNQKTLTMERLKDLHASLATCPGENVLAEEPAGLKVALMHYQKQALAWMLWRERQKPRGGILADDMGLGKTLTMISLVLAARNRDEAKEAGDGEDTDDEDDDSDDEGQYDYRGGTLIICPSSLICMWENEVKSNVTGRPLSVLVHHGAYRKRHPKPLCNYDVIITTYQIAMRDHNLGVLFAIRWHRIILDEAHVVRNFWSAASKAVCALRGKYRWSLTGTPIHNTAMDIYALLKFLRCTPFDDLDHWRKWTNPTTFGGRQRLNTVMMSLMLRRTKAQLQGRGFLTSLPTKETVPIDVHLDMEETIVYHKVLMFSKSLFAQYLSQRTASLRQQSENCRGIGQNVSNLAHHCHQTFRKLHQGNEEVKSSEVLVLLLRLRQICCHPGLIDAILEDDDEQNGENANDSTQFDLIKKLLELTNTVGASTSSVFEDGSVPKNISDNHEFVKASSRMLLRSNPVFRTERPSSKIKKILEVLRECVLNTGEKAIVVSQFSGFLILLRSHIENLGIEVLEFTGKTAIKDRQLIVNEFNNPVGRKRVLLLSLSAGCVGLNLVEANNLLLIDLHWNPQLELQAQDRIYRVGQKKNVKIYKFLCRGTVEEHIKSLQDQKLALAHRVLTGAQIEDANKLTIDDLKLLFGMKDMEC